MSNDITSPHPGYGDDRAADIEHMRSLETVAEQIRTARLEDDLEIIREHTAESEPPAPTGDEVASFGDDRDAEVVRLLTVEDPDDNETRSRSRHPSRSPGGPVPFTETGNATRFVSEYRDRIRYITAWRKWIVWGEHSWTVDIDNVIITELGKSVSQILYQIAADATSSGIAKAAGKWAETSSRRSVIAATIELSRGIDGIPIDAEDLDRDPWILGVENGVVDLRTGAHRPGTPEDLVTRQTGTAYAADAEAPTWDRCLGEWFPDPETRAYVQRLAGSALVGRQREHVFVIHYGTGRNGKGTFVRALAGTLGDYFAVPHKSLIVAERNERHDTERAALFRIRLAVAGESSRNQALNEAQIKNLTGDDRISARRLYENPWEFDPSHSLWLQTNYLPTVVGRDPGIWERMRVVPWDVMFDDARRDAGLAEKLDRERPGILRWLVDGCLEWQRIGLDEPPEVVAATAHYRAGEDTLGRFAGAVGLEFARGLAITAKEIRETLEQWANDEGIRTPPAWKDVSEWLTNNDALAAGRGRRKGVRGAWWDGVGIPTLGTRNGDERPDNA